MKALIVDDEFTSQLILQKLLMEHGETRVVSTGKEAIDAFSEALMLGDRFDLICLDIMMPDIDGQHVLKEIRALEDIEGLHGDDAAKVIMISSLNDKKNIMEAFKSQCEAYLVKPIDGEKLYEHLETFGMILK
ncbi:two-component system, chemotaxis family, response regulator CheY [Malonomonas rubra DSM 5091]|uniref:Two-component system, chemotaxis family, response regulator CheY n=1 Tax=Malonomonas rubra DSM 5091 TaxID=1122189 RepID=A0A1M6HAI7_MALRU|nr:response regulator [Malonomonas rubra]SHJ19242.1 two-component system, chemotaxis family, response regulator CheY [Malonomonas rubra DSM 5091]